MSRFRWLAAILTIALWVPAASACQGSEDEQYVLLVHKPTLIPEGAVILEVGVSMSENRARSFRGPMLRARVTRAVVGDFAEKQIDLAFSLASSCEYLGWPGPVRYVVGFLDKDAAGALVRGRTGRAVLRPVLYYDASPSPEREQQVVEDYDRYYRP